MYQLKEIVKFLAAFPPDRRSHLASTGTSDDDAARRIDPGFDIVASAVGTRARALTRHKYTSAGSASEHNGRNTHAIANPEPLCFNGNLVWNLHRKLPTIRTGGRQYLP